MRVGKTKHLWNQWTKKPLFRWIMFKVITKKMYTKGWGVTECLIDVQFYLIFFTYGGLKKELSTKRIISEEKWAWDLEETTHETSIQKWNIFTSEASFRWLGGKIWRMCLCNRPKNETSFFRTIYSDKRRFRLHKDTRYQNNTQKAVWTRGEWPEKLKETLNLSCMLWYMDL